MGKRRKKKPVAIAGQFFSRNTTNGKFPTGKVYYWNIPVKKRTVPIKTGDRALVYTSYGKAIVYIADVLFKLPDGIVPERSVAWFIVTAKPEQEETKESPVGGSAEPEGVSKEDEPKEFKNKLRYILARRKMTQSELAQEIGMTSASISQYATGKRLPSIEVLRKMAEVLKVSPQWLAGNM